MKFGSELGRRDACLVACVDAARLYHGTGSLAKCIHDSTDWLTVSEILAGWRSCLVLAAGGLTKRVVPALPARSLSGWAWHGPMRPSLGMNDPLGPAQHRTA
jgi:hypothetical protein